MRRRIVVVAGLACLLAFSLARQALRAHSAQAVEAEPVRAQRLSPSVLATGVLAYTGQVTLMPEVLGRVRAILVSEGERVREGQPVLRLDAHDASAEVAQFSAAESEARIAVLREQREADFQATRASRYRELRQQGMATAAQFDEFAHAEEAALLQLRNARQALLQATARLAQAREALARTNIRAPLAGQVTSVEAHVGETVVPSVSNVAGSALLTIADPAERLAELDVDEADVAAVRAGQAARVFVAADPDRPLQAVVRKIAVMPTQQPRGRVYKTRLSLVDANPAAFRPGMGCRAEIFVGQVEPVLAVPQQAVLGADESGAGGAGGANRGAVFVLAGGVAHRREVTLGQSDDANVEVASGVAAGEVVVTGPAQTLHRLRDGDRAEARAR